MIEENAELGSATAVSSTHGYFFYRPENLHRSLLSQQPGKRERGQLPGTALLHIAHFEN